MSNDTLLHAIADLQDLTSKINALSGSLGEGKLAFPEKDNLALDGDGSFKLFDETVAVRGTIRAKAEYLGLDAAVDAFGTGEAIALRAGHNSGRFVLEVGVDAQGEGGLGGEGLAVSAKAGLSASLRYEHHVAAPPNRTAATAFRRLVLDSRLPNLLDLREAPERGEVHGLERKLTLDFGLEARAGYEMADDRALAVAGGVALPLKLGVEASLLAALGLGLHERMRLVVGRTAQLEGDWIRVRLQRARERRLTFGVTFALALHYDLGSGLVALFEEAVDQVPTERLMEAAKQIATFTNPAKLQELLSAEIAEVVDDLVAEGIVDALDGVIPFARSVVEAYASLDERVQSLWERLLAGADLGAGSQVVGWLEQLAGLDPDQLTIDTFLENEDAKELLEAIEAISGSSAEEMLFGDETLRRTLEDVSGVAQQALDFLANTPAEVIEKIQAFAERTGIARTVETLAKIDTVEKLETEVSTRIRKLAARLAGKAVGALDSQDLAKVNAWAEKMAKWLDPNDAQFGGGLVKQIAENLAKVKADYGLSIGFEIDRVTRTSAVLDLELEPSNKHQSLRRKVSRALSAGKAVDVVAVLADASKMVEKSERAEHEIEDDPGFRIRECAFASERVRTSATSILFDLAGLGRLFGSRERGFTRRIEQSTVRITDRLADPEVTRAKRFRRDGHYAAGYQRGVRTGSLEIESAIWHVADESGFGLDPEAKYTGERSSSLRLAFTWQDDTPTARETAALYRLLAELRFEPVGDDGPRTAGEMMAEGPSSRLGLELRFDGALLDSVGEALAEDGGGELYRRAFLNACHRFYAEPFVTRGRLSASPPIEKTAGEALSRMLAGSERVRDALTSSNLFHNDPDFDTVRVTFADGKVASYAVGGPSAGDREPITPYFIGIQNAYLRGRKRLVEGEESVFELRRQAGRDRLPEDYRRLSRALAQSWYRSSIGSLLWPSSMFSTWLWLALVGVADPDALAEAQGVATLQWRRKLAEGAEEGQIPWAGPMYWRLRDGLPNLLANANVFPIA